jgi:hypothetical protein
MKLEHMIYKLLVLSHTMKKYSLGNHFFCSVAVHIDRLRDAVCVASPTQVQKLMLFRSVDAGRKISTSMCARQMRDCGYPAHDGTACWNRVLLCKQSALCVSSERGSVASGTSVTGSSHVPRTHTTLLHVHGSERYRSCHCRPVSHCISP